MEKKYDFENNYGKEWHCTQKQWNYWNRKEIAEHKKKMDKWYDAMFPENEEGISRFKNSVLWGTENPSPVEKSIGRQFHKDKKLKKKVNKIINSYSKIK